MRIIILTFHYANNYGAVLQCYALSKILKELDHDVEILDFFPKPKKMNLKQKVRSFILSNRFKKFRRIYLPKLTKPYNSFESIKDNYPEADCYIVGSDQVWNPQISKDNLFIYLFNFLKNNEKRFSYAASFGIERWNNNEMTPLMTELLNRFTAISIRENVGVQLCEKIFNHNSIQVLDPTLLLDNYNDITKNCRSNKKTGIVVYKFKTCKDLYNLFPHLSSELKENVSCINDHKINKNGAGTSYFTSVPKWINMIRNSSFVLTDSFHCMVFAIIYRRPFIAMPAHPERLSRMFSLLQELGLEDRFYRNYDEIYTTNTWKNPINYDEVHKKLSEKRAFSLSFIKKTLNSVEG